MKKYKYTTYNSIAKEIRTVVTEAFNAKQARKEAQMCVANSRDNEVRHGRITLIK